jgi:hypothetical protein
MKKLLVYLDSERHEDLKELAHQRKTTMGALLRQAMETALEDDLDSIRAQRLLDEAANDTAGSLSWEEYKATRAGRVRAAS